MNLRTNFSHQQLRSPRLISISNVSLKMIVAPFALAQSTSIHQWTTAMHPVGLACAPAACLLAE